MGLRYLDMAKKYNELILSMDRAGFVKKEVRGGKKRRPERLLI